MHNVHGQQSAQLGTYSGLVTLANPAGLPEGASPRNQNVDFTVGGAQTRGPLINPFTYQSNAAGPSPGTAATNVSTSGNAWRNPSNVLSEGGYATANITALALSITNVQVLLYGGIYYAILSFSQVVPAYASGQKYTFSGLTSYPELNGQVLAPYTGTGPTLTANQQIFQFGSSAYGPAADTGTAQVSGLFLPTDALEITEFAFSVASTVTPQGFAQAILGYSSVAGATLSVQILKAGNPAGNAATIPLPLGASVLPLGGINDLFGASWIWSDLNNTQFGLRLSASGIQAGEVFLGYTTLTAYFLPTQNNFNYVTTFEDSFGNIKTLALDSSGEWWLEDVTNNPGVLSPLMSGAPAGSFASSFTADSRQYIATSDLLQGNYIPQQYTGQWTDRISQVGPGMAPQFTPIASSGTTFDITSITQPPANSDITDPGHLSVLLWSAGPGSTSPGNVITVYYSPAFYDGSPQPEAEDSTLVNAFNAGNAVYIYLSGAPFGNGVYLVTSVGVALPPGVDHERYYFTVQVPTISYQLIVEAAGQYQMTVATMKTTVPVPGLEIGNIATVTGSSVANWDSNWTITQTLNAGSFNITETVVSAGIATYSYTLVSGTVPAAGQLVTITGTNNANGQLNQVNATIASATGGTSGTFTIAVALPDFASTSEEGQATTAGTIFLFDPGAAAVGSDTDVIYGNATGGALVFSGNGQFVAAGTRKGTVFFITRNGFYTRPAPPVTFTAPSETTAIKASNIPIGPPNVIGRAIVFTEAGSNGVPGASFYTIPEPVQYIVDDVTYTANSLFINDNTTTTATFSFTDAVLLNAEEIDIQGNDLFNLGELGEAAWCTQYAGRAVWGRVRTKIQNFLNLSFDGGYLANPGGNLLPLGWSLNNSTVPGGTAPTLLVSPVFGNSYYMSNTSGSTQAQFMMLYQSAYQDYNQVAILQNQTAYSIRITCRTPSSATSGALVVDLTTYDQGTGFGQIYGSFVLNLADMTSNMVTYEGTLLTDSTLNIPSDLVLRVWGQDIPNGADIEIDGLTIFPTEEPTNLTGLTISYLDDNESFDLVTGGQDTSVVNNQPANGGFTMHDELYIVKESSLGYLSDAPNQEPANWNPFKEVSNVAGASGINAFDVGEEWAVMGCQNGLFLFNGGAPVPIQLEIPDIWQAINWEYGHTICVRNDVARRKIFCAIPLPTPNPWMKDTTVNRAPTTPNVILMLNYEGIATVEQLMDAAPMYVTMMGKLAVHDFRRKWSLWPIPTPYLGMVKRNELEALMMFCNGIDSSKIYYLGDTPTGQDDGVAFTSSYCTYGFVDQEQAMQNPMLGQYNKRYVYYDVLANGEGTASLTFYQNTLNAPYPYEVPGGLTLTDPAANDLEGPLNEFAQRLFVEIVMEDGWFNLSRVTLAGGSDKWSPIRGF